MRKSFHLSKCLLLTLALSLFTCEPNERITPETSGSLLLGIELPETNATDGRITANDKLSILLTIENESGVTILDQEVLKLTKLNNEFITKPISLVSGNYKIVDFMIINDLEEVIYLTPKEGSPLAYLVDQPVPIPFSISKNLVTKLAPEVISTERKSPKDFGYSSFAFTPVPTFDFLIALFALNNETNSYELTEGSLQVKADGEVVYDSALYAGTVQITLPANHDAYELIVTKPLWETVSNTYTQGELEQHFSEEDLGPLHIYLNKTTLDNTFTDSRDGTVYKTVTIGNQVWMAEDLKYLPSVVGPGTGSTETPYYYVYDYDGTNVAEAKATANFSTYGVLYNWEAAKVACPPGWHLPSDAEWTELTDCLGGESVAGGKLKEAGTAHWNSPNTGATNETGFTALPNGDRHFNGNFGAIGYHGHWWTSTESTTGQAWYRSMHYSANLVNRGPNYVDLGLSVRCVRDNENTTFTDSRDGTVYKTVTIGNQVWMAENLKATMFSDDAAIPLVSDNAMWAGLTTPAYSWYNNDKDTYGPTYGALYNWYTVNTGKLCPTGWHVPSYAEWNTLVNYLGGYMVAGGKLKEAGTAHWNSPNTGATNSSGFSALPGGERVDVNGSFIWIGYSGGWWSSTEGSPWDAWIYRLFCDTSIAHSGNDYFKQGALSVRCVRDN